MFVNAKEVPSQSKIQCDICVIGAGAAGITLAREFLGKSTEICLLESGGLVFDTATQDLYKGENIGLPYSPLDSARLRFFGGTTNHWGGLMTPNESWAFEKKSWIKDSGWPVTFSELQPYFHRAAESLSLPPGFWGPKSASWIYDDPKKEPYKGYKLPLTQFNPKLALVNPVRMGRVHQDELRDSKNVTVYLNSNVLSLETDEYGKRITEVKVATLEKNSFSVAAKYFVLAAGGIENPRILLLSNSVMKDGIGNDRGLVGRYFADHIHFTAGYVTLNKKHTLFKNFSKGTTLPGYPDIGSLFLLHTTAEAQKKHQLGYAGIRILPYKCERNNIWDKFACKFDSALERLGMIKGPDHRFKIRYVSDPVPNPNSRVTLSDDTDKLGLRRVKLNWQSTDQDMRTARETIQLLGTDLASSNLGRVKSLLHSGDQEWPDSFIGGAYHHMGTTRMSDAPSRGVVDSKCKVHGISNLYVAGSSVFPTYALGSTTFLIIALATRLADHIKRFRDV